MGDLRLHEEEGGAVDLPRLHVLEVLRLRLILAQLLHIPVGGQHLVHNGSVVAAPLRHELARQVPAQAVHGQVGLTGLGAHVVLQLERGKLDTVLALARVPVDARP